PYTKQGWHSHDKIEEVLLVLDGQLTILYLNDNEEQKTILENGDLVRFEKTMHTIKNTTDHTSKFIVFKLILTGKKKTDIFVDDKNNQS
ncbi:cupin domain-containing protein, partial [archaeon]|nr:cupin domain-containing protein [archaeon]